MARPGTVFLMYHELELPRRALVQSEPGYVRYVLRESTFRAQVDWLRNHGWRGLSVGEALHFPAEKSVALTFDDGCETDWIAAAPALRDAGFQATFYITSGFLNRPGYLSTAQLRELHSAGFEIGCHSMTHAYLNDLAPDQLRAEIADARSLLEDAIGAPVEHFSCPGGRYNRQTLAQVEQAGYRSLATSDAHENPPPPDRFRLGRVAIMRNTGERQFAEICAGRGLWKIRLAESARRAMKTALGNALYDRMRASLLRQS